MKNLQHDIAHGRHVASQLDQRTTDMQELPLDHAARRPARRRTGLLDAGNLLLGRVDRVEVAVDHVVEQRVQQQAHIGAAVADAFVELTCFLDLERASRAVPLADRYQPVLADEQRDLGQIGRLLVVGVADEERVRLEDFEFRAPSCLLDVLDPQRVQRELVARAARARPPRDRRGRPKPVTPERHSPRSHRGRRSPRSTPW